MAQTGWPWKSSKFQDLLLRNSYQPVCCRIALLRSDSLIPVRPGPLYCTGSLMLTRARVPCVTGKPPKVNVSPVYPNSLSSFINLCFLPCFFLSWRRRPNNIICQHHQTNIADNICNLPPQPFIQATNPRSDDVSICLRFGNHRNLEVTLEPDFFCLCIRSYTQAARAVTGSAFKRATPNLPAYHCC